MNYVVTRCLPSMEGVTRNVKTDLRGVKYLFRTKLEFKGWNRRLSYLSIGDRDVCQFSE